MNNWMIELHKGDVRENMQLSAPPARSGNNLFQRVRDIKFCKGCGESVSIDTLTCKMCGASHFLSGEIAEYLAGYVQLSKEGLLKKYLKTFDKKKSSIRMNDKRIAVKLLIDNGLIDVGDKDIIETIYKTFWKRY